MQTKCRAQDCNQNLAPVKSHLWTSGCSCETVWAIHEAADGKLKQHGLPDLQDSRMSPEIHRSDRPSAETWVFLQASRVALRAAQPGHLLQAPCWEHTATAPSVLGAEAWPRAPHFHDTWWAARAQPVNEARTDLLNPQGRHRNPAAAPGTSTAGEVGLPRDTEHWEQSHQPRVRI